MANPDHEKNEMRYEIRRLQKLNDMAYDRIDELHDTIHKMEVKFQAMASELKAVRNFSIDMVNDYALNFKHTIKRKYEMDIESAQQAKEELEATYEEGIEWMEECLQNEDSDALWKIILEE
jgi:sugar-specific transcriptional regulator TrmB